MTPSSAGNSLDKQHTWTKPCSHPRKERAKETKKFSTVISRKLLNTFKVKRTQSLRPKLLLSWTGSYLYCKVRVKSSQYLQTPPNKKLKLKKTLTSMTQIKLLRMAQQMISKSHLQSSTGEAPHSSLLPLAKRMLTLETQSPWKDSTLISCPPIIKFEK